MNAAELGNLLQRWGFKLATAESCTGGLLASKLTDVPGSSNYFVGGVIAYSNQVKIKILNVKKETIEKYGAVSKECAEEMVKGVTEIFGVDVGISTTGIAGPSGGTEEKPVGLVYMGFKIRDDVWVERFIFKGSRIEIKTQIAEKAIEILQMKLNPRNDLI